MIQDRRLVFDEDLSSARTDPEHRVVEYTSLEHTDFLSAANQLALQATVRVRTSFADLPVSIAVEHSGDGRHWKPKSEVPELSGVVLKGAETAVLAGGERWPARPSQRFVRLCLRAGDEVHPFALRLRVDVVARTRTTKIPALRADPPRLPLAAAMLGVRSETLHEAHRLIQGSGHLTGAERYGAVLRAMTPQGREDIGALVRRVRELDKDQKRLLGAAARGLVALVESSEEGPLP